MSVPLLKLGYLLVKSVSKPIANSIKKQAVTRPAFRRFCVELAETYHKLDLRLKATKKTFIVQQAPKHGRAQHEACDSTAEQILREKPYDVNKAIEMGGKPMCCCHLYNFTIANFIGEAVIFTIAGILITIEAYRNRATEMARRESIEERLAEIKVQAEKIQNLEIQLNEIISAFRHKKPNE